MFLLLFISHDLLISLILNNESLLVIWYRFLLVSKSFDVYLLVVNNACYLVIELTYDAMNNRPRLTSSFNRLRFQSLSKQTVFDLNTRAIFEIFYLQKWQKCYKLCSMFYKVDGRDNEHSMHALHTNNDALLALKLTW